MHPHTAHISKSSTGISGRLNTEPLSYYLGTPAHEPMLQKLVAVSAARSTRVPYARPAVADVSLQPAPLFPGAKVCLVFANRDLPARRSSASCPGDSRRLRPHQLHPRSNCSETAVRSLRVQPADELQVCADALSRNQPQLEVVSLASASADRRRLCSHLPIRLQLMHLL